MMQDLTSTELISSRCPCSKFDICLEPEKTTIEFRNWKEILDFVKSSVTTVLKKFSQFPQSSYTVTSSVHDSEVKELDMSIT